MKIRLEVSDETYQQLKEKLESAGFSVTEDDDEEFILHQKDQYVSHLSLRNDNGDKIHVPVEDILYMESFGHNIEAITPSGRFVSSEPLKRLLEILNPYQFIRISNSVIINRKHLKEIMPTFGMKFRLKMSDGSTVKVTRSYYSAFREFFNF